MTATERAKRSDALYYETFSVTRRVLCDMIANREADLEDARAENAKLRELVRVSIEFCADGMCGIYDNCPLNAADGRCMFDERARELGVIE